MKPIEKQRILIVDDDIAVCASISLLLKKQGFETLSIHRPQLVLENLVSFQPDLLILDMNFTIETSGKQGLALLKRILETAPSLPVILMTGWATVQLAVQGMKLGAKDFIAKPWDNKHLLNSIKSILHLFKPPANHEQERVKADQEMNMIGKDPTFLEVIDMATRVAPTEASVLILGDSGTGKELLAEYIHGLSNRKDNPFVKVNLGGISSSLFESEMFGHAKGAYTDAHKDRIGRFTKADKGTIFLDEIGDLEFQNQVKLLRVLQDKQYELLGSSRTIKSNFRTICATNKDLNLLVNHGRFREDLFYRINLITLQLPTLDQRRSDIPILVQHFAKQLCKHYDRPVPEISKNAFTYLKEQTYPGNIRGLRNEVERTILLNFHKSTLDVDDFIQSNLNMKQSQTKIQIPKVGALSLDEMEREMIKKTLIFHAHNISKTARSLGITRSALYRRLEKYKIKHEPQN